MANHDLNFSSPGATIPTPDPLAPDPFAPRDPLTLPGAGLNPGGITSRPQMSSPMLNSLATPVAPAATANLPVSADQARTYTTQINALADERAAVLASASAPSAETLAALDARRDQLLRQIATTHSWQENGPEMAVLRQVLNQREARERVRLVSQVAATLIKIDEEAKGLDGNGADPGSYATYLQRQNAFLSTISGAPELVTSHADGVRRHIRSMLNDANRRVERYMSARNHSWGTCDGDGVENALNGCFNCYVWQRVSQEIQNRTGRTVLQDASRNCYSLNPFLDDAYTISIQANVSSNNRHLNSHRAQAEYNPGAADVSTLLPTSSVDIPRLLQGLSSENRIEQSAALFVLSIGTGDSVRSCVDAVSARTILGGGQIPALTEEQRAEFIAAVNALVGKTPTGGTPTAEQQLAAFNAFLASNTKLPEAERNVIQSLVTTGTANDAAVSQMLVARAQAQGDLQAAMFMASDGSPLSRATLDAQTQVWLRTQQAYFDRLQFTPDAFSAEVQSRRNQSIWNQMERTTVRRQAEMTFALCESEGTSNGATWQRTRHQRNVEAQTRADAFFRAADEMLSTTPSLQGNLRTLGQAREQVTAEAREMYRRTSSIAGEVHAGMDGMGTDEKKVIGALRRIRFDTEQHYPILARLGYSERTYLDRVYRNNHHSNLMSDIEGDFSGCQLDICRDLLNNDQPAACAAELMDALCGGNDRNLWDGAGASWSRTFGGSKENVEAVFRTHLARFDAIENKEERATKRREFIAQVNRVFNERYLPQLTAGLPSENDPPRYERDEFGVRTEVPRGECREQFGSFDDILSRHFSKDELVSLRAQWRDDKVLAGVADVHEMLNRWSIPRTDVARRFEAECLNDLGQIDPTKVREFEARFNLQYKNDFTAEELQRHGGSQLRAFIHRRLGSGVSRDLMLAILDVGAATTDQEQTAARVHVQVLKIRLGTLLQSQSKNWTYLSETLEAPLASRMTAEELNQCRGLNPDSQAARDIFGPNARRALATLNAGNTTAFRALSDSEAMDLVNRLRTATRQRLDARFVEETGTSVSAHLTARYQVHGGGQANHPYRLRLELARSRWENGHLNDGERYVEEVNGFNGPANKDRLREILGNRPMEADDSPVDPRHPRRESLVVLERQANELLTRAGRRPPPARTDDADYARVSTLYSLGFRHLSGDNWFDTKQMLRGQPQTLEEMQRLVNERIEHERTLFGRLLVNDNYMMLRKNELQAQIDQRAAGSTNDLRRMSARERAQFTHLYEDFQHAADTYREKKEQVADQVATAVSTVGSIAVTFIIPGSGFLLTAIYTFGAVAATSLVTNYGVKKLIRGDGYQVIGNEGLFSGEGFLGLGMTKEGEHLVEHALVEGAMMAGAGAVTRGINNFVVVGAAAKAEGVALTTVEKVLARGVTAEKLVAQGMAAQNAGLKTAYTIAQHRMEHVVAKFVVEIPVNSAGEFLVGSTSHVLKNLDRLISEGGVEAVLSEAVSEGRTRALYAAGATAGFIVLAKGGARLREYVRGRRAAEAAHETAEPTRTEAVETAAEAGGTTELTPRQRAEQAAKELQVLSEQARVAEEARLEGRETGSTEHEVVRQPAETEVRNNTADAEVRNADAEVRATESAEARNESGGDRDVPVDGDHVEFVSFRTERPVEGFEGDGVQASATNGEALPHTPETLVRANNLEAADLQPHLETLGINSTTELPTTPEGWGRLIEDATARLTAASTAGDVHLVSATVDPTVTGEPHVETSSTSATHTDASTTSHTESTTSTHTEATSSTHAESTSSTHTESTSSTHTETTSGTHTEATSGTRTEATSGTHTETPSTPPSPETAARLGLDANPEVRPKNAGEWIEVTNKAIDRAVEGKTGVEAHKARQEVVDQMMGEMRRCNANDFALDMVHMRRLPTAEAELRAAAGFGATERIPRDFASLQKRMGERLATTADPVQQDHIRQAFQALYNRRSEGWLTRLSSVERAYGTLGSRDQCFLLTPEALRIRATRIVGADVALSSRADLPSKHPATKAYDFLLGHVNFRHIDSQTNTWLRNLGIESHVTLSRSRLLEALNSRINTPGADRAELLASYWALHARMPHMAGDRGFWNPARLIWGRERTFLNFEGRPDAPSHDVLRARAARHLDPVRAVKSTPEGGRGTTDPSGAPRTRPDKLNYELALSHIGHRGNLRVLTAAEVDALAKAAIAARPGARASIERAAAYLKIVNEFGHIHDLPGFRQFSQQYKQFQQTVAQGQREFGLNRGEAFTRQQLLQGADRRIAELDAQFRVLKERYEQAKRSGASDEVKKQIREEIRANYRKSEELRGLRDVMLDLRAAGCISPDGRFIVRGDASEFRIVSNKVNGKRVQEVKHLVEWMESAQDRATYHYKARNDLLRKLGLDRLATWEEAVAAFEKRVQFLEKRIKRLEEGGPLEQRFLEGVEKKKLDLQLQLRAQLTVQRETLIQITNRLNEIRSRAVGHDPDLTAILAMRTFAERVGALRESVRQLERVKRIMNDDWTVRTAESATRRGREIDARDRRMSPLEVGEAGGPQDLIKVRRRVQQETERLRQEVLETKRQELEGRKRELDTQIAELQTQLGRARAEEMSAAGSEFAGDENLVARLAQLRKLRKSAQQRLTVLAKKGEQSWTERLDRVMERSRRAEPEVRESFPTRERIEAEVARRKPGRPAEIERLAQEDFAAICDKLEAECTRLQQRQAELTSRIGTLTEAVAAGGDRAVLKAAKKELGLAKKELAQIERRLNEEFAVDKLDGILDKHLANCRRIRTETDDATSFAQILEQDLARFARQVRSELEAVHGHGPGTERMVRNRVEQVIEVHQRGITQDRDLASHTLETIPMNAPNGIETLAQKAADAAVAARLRRGPEALLVEHVEIEVHAATRKHVRELFARRERLMEELRDVDYQIDAGEIAAKDIGRAQPRYTPSRNADRSRHRQEVSREELTLTQAIGRRRAIEQELLALHPEQIERRASEFAREQARRWQRVVSEQLTTHRETHTLLLRQKSLQTITRTVETPVRNPRKKGKAFPKREKVQIEKTAEEFTPEFIDAHVAHEGEQMMRAAQDMLTKARQNVATAQKKLQKAGEKLLGKKQADGIYEGGSLELNSCVVDNGLGFGEAISREAALARIGYRAKQVPKDIAEVRKKMDETLTKVLDPKARERILRSGQSLVNEMRATDPRALELEQMAALDQWLQRGVQRRGRSTRTEWALRELRLQEVSESLTVATLDKQFTMLMRATQNPPRTLFFIPMNWVPPRVLRWCNWFIPAPNAALRLKMAKEFLLSDFRMGKADPTIDQMCAILKIQPSPRLTERQIIRAADAVRARARRNSYGELAAPDDALAAELYLLSMIPKAERSAWRPIQALQWAKDLVLPTRLRAGTGEKPGKTYEEWLEVVRARTKEKGAAIEMLGGKRGDDVLWLIQNRMNRFEEFRSQLRPGLTESEFNGAVDFLRQFVGAVAPHRAVGFMRFHEPVLRALRISSPKELKIDTFMPLDRMCTLHEQWSAATRALEIGGSAKLYIGNHIWLDRLVIWDHADVALAKVDARIAKLDELHQRGMEILTRRGLHETAREAQRLHLEERQVLLTERRTVEAQRDLLCDIQRCVGGIRQWRLQVRDTHPHGLKDIATIEERFAAFETRDTTLEFIGLTRGRSYTKQQIEAAAQAKLRETAARRDAVERAIGDSPMHRDMWNLYKKRAMEQCCKIESGRDYLIEMGQRGTIHIAPSAWNKGVIAKRAGTVHERYKPAKVDEPFSEARLKGYEDLYEVRRLFGLKEGAALPKTSREIKWAYEKRVADLTKGGRKLSAETEMRLEAATTMMHDLVHPWGWWMRPWRQPLRVDQVTRLKYRVECIQERVMAREILGMDPMGKVHTAREARLAHDRQVKLHPERAVELDLALKHLYRLKGYVKPEVKANDLWWHEKGRLWNPMNWPVINMVIPRPLLNVVTEGLSLSTHLAGPINGHRLRKMPGEMMGRAGEQLGRVSDAVGGTVRDTAVGLFDRVLFQRRWGGTRAEYELYNGKTFTEMMAATKKQANQFQRDLAVLGYRPSSTARDIALGTGVAGREANIKTFQDPKLLRNHVEKLIADAKGNPHKVEKILEAYHRVCEALPSREHWRFYILPPSDTLVGKWGGRAINRTFDTFEAIYIDLPFRIPLLIFGVHYLAYWMGIVKDPPKWPFGSTLEDMWEDIKSRMGGWKRIMAIKPHDQIFDPEEAAAISDEGWWDFNHMVMGEHGELVHVAKRDEGDRFDMASDFFVAAEIPIAGDDAAGNGNDGGEDGGNQKDGIIPVVFAPGTEEQKDRPQTGTHGVQHNTTSKQKSFEDAKRQLAQIKLPGSRGSTDDITYRNTASAQTPVDRVINNAVDTALSKLRLPQ